MTNERPKPDPQTDNPLISEQATQSADTFGERITSPSSQPPPADDADEPEGPVFREHDEFGEWLERNPR